MKLRIIELSGWINSPENEKIEPFTTDYETIPRLGENIHFGASYPNTIWEVVDVIHYPKFYRSYNADVFVKFKRKTN